MPRVNAGARILVLGATSGIAKAVSYELAKRGCHLILAARDQDDLATLVPDLSIRHQVEVHGEDFDALAFDEHDHFVERCCSRFKEGLDGVVLCYGALHEQAEAQADATLAKQMLDINLTSAVLLLERFAAYFEERENGLIAAISSVAGDRGRQSNYLYGSTKAGLSAYLQGLRNRLHHRGIPVLTIKPGFVDTPMTAGKLDANSRMVASPERVGRDIVRALGRKNVVYTPWFWRPIMFVIRSIPEWLFKRLKM